MKFQEGIPIYLQLTQEISNRILSGQYQSGEKIGSVRELALEFGVNPNTVQKALALAEEKGLVFALGPEGRFVSEDKELLSQLRQKTIEKEVSSFILKIKNLGISLDEVLVQLQKEEF